MNAVSGCFCLWGGTLAGTNSTCRSEWRLAAAWASARCPRWMGSKLPPKRPIFIPLFPCPIFTAIPVSFVVCRALWQGVLPALLHDYVPHSPFCTSEFCGKRHLRLGCEQGGSCSPDVAPGCG